MLAEMPDELLHGGAGVKVDEVVGTYERGRVGADGALLLGVQAVALVEREVAREVGGLQGGGPAVNLHQPVGLVELVQVAANGGLGDPQLGSKVADAGRSAPPHHLDDAREALLREHG